MMGAKIGDSWNWEILIWESVAISDSGYKY